MTSTEADLSTSERDSWREGHWTAAILSFTSRHVFLPLLRLRDATRLLVLSRPEAGFFLWIGAMVVVIAGALWGTPATPHLNSRL